MHRWDFVAAYLQGELLSLLDREVAYCHMPAGFKQDGKDRRPCILEVKKPIYGLAQAGGRWQPSL